MKTNKTSISLLTALAILCSTAWAVPAINQESVTIAQNRRSGLVTVHYVLTGEPAVVTVDFQTNNVADGTWASIGGEKYADVVGDVNMLVTNLDSTCTLFWQPNKANAWPNHHIANGNFRAVVKAWATNAPPPYMIVDLQDNPGETRYYPSAGAIPYGITNDLYKTTRLAFRLVPAAQVQWRMGAKGGTVSSGGELGVANSSRETQHLVTFTSDWYMGVYPVTQKQNRFFGTVSSSSTQYLPPSPSTVTNNSPETDTYPVESVVWTALRGYHVSKIQGTDTYPKGRWPDDGHELSSVSGIYKARTVTGLPSLDLPTDAMWEYTCRAGTSTATYEGDITVASGTALDPVLDEIAWYTANSGGVTHPVGLKKANPWGFYDMLGNVNEWCLDEWRYNDGYMSADDVEDPPGIENSGRGYPIRVLRGGSYQDTAYKCRSACRDNKRYGHDNGNDTPALKTVGYRLCCDAMALK